MNTDDRQVAEILENEQWLAANWTDHETTSWEHLKLRVRVELGERWLAQRLDSTLDPASAELRDQVRAAVDQSRPQSILPWRKAPRYAIARLGAAGLGLAAMLWMGVSLFTSHMPIDGDAVVADSLDDVWLFEDESQVDEDLFDIDDEIAELSTALASLDDTDWSEESDF